MVAYGVQMKQIAILYANIHYNPTMKSFFTLLLLSVELALQFCHHITLMLFKSILVQPSVNAHQPVKVGETLALFVHRDVVT